MTSPELQKYLAGVFSLELDAYTQAQTISELKRHHASLARSFNVPQPALSAPTISFFDCFIFSGIISGIIVGLIDLIYEWNKASNIFHYVAAVIAALINGVIGLFIGGIVIGLIAYGIIYSKQKGEAEERYQRAVSDYDAKVKQQNVRLCRERNQQKALAQEINALVACYKKTQQDLKTAYSYGILAPDYRNIYAVSSMLGYLQKGRTHTLCFDRSTGDQGAYNIYENECRLDRIITNTEEIISRLDQVINYQYELAIGLERATKKVDALCGNVTSQLNRISGSVSSIERNQQIIAYNSECTARGMDFLCWCKLFD